MQTTITCSAGAGTTGVEFDMEEKHQKGQMGL